MAILKTTTETTETIDGKTLKTQYVVQIRATYCIFLGGKKYLIVGDDVHGVPLIWGSEPKRALYAVECFRHGAHVITKNAGIFCLDSTVSTHDKKQKPSLMRELLLFMG